MLINPFFSHLYESAQAITIGTERSNTKIAYTNVCVCEIEW